jgi:hypothetical protein
MNGKILYVGTPLVGVLKPVFFGTMYLVIWAATNYPLCRGGHEGRPYMADNSDNVHDFVRPAVCSRTAFTSTGRIGGAFTNSCRT